MKNKIVFIIIALLIIASGWIAISSKNNKDTANSKPDVNTITDSSTGLSFNISKNFEPIPKEELAALNPGFGYGFIAPEDSQAFCVVSQTKLKGSGAVTGEELRDGILKEVKKVHPDVNLENAEVATKPAKFGDAMGVLLQMTYHEAKNKLRRVEMIALGKSFQVIAYCQSLNADSVKYYDEFTSLFSSIKLVNK